MLQSFAFFFHQTQCRALLFLRSSRYLCWAVDGQTFGTHMFTTQNQFLQGFEGQFNQKCCEYLL